MSEEAAEEKAVTSLDEQTTDYETDRPPTGASDLSGVVADNEGSSSEQAEGSQRNDEEGEERGEMGVGTQEKAATLVEGGSEGEEGAKKEGDGEEGGTAEDPAESAEEGAKKEEGETAESAEEGAKKKGDGEEGGTAEDQAESAEEGAKRDEVEEEEEEEERVISYDYEEMKSKPEIVSLTAGSMLELHYSFGYECQKHSNLVVLAKEVVAYAAGNLLVLLDLHSQEQAYRRTLSGGGIGAIAVHPSRSYLAVGEKGQQPVIAVYTYPELRLHRVLRGGTEAVYSHLDFAPGEGRLMASVGASPDFMLTVWDWERENIVLRSKAFSQDIYRVTFSPENPGQLTTSGTGHIRFWKMATTFTGLKLQGQLGKFGRTELSDIAAYVELPDGKVLSGTEWGNLLLWDGGFIKVEISRKGKKNCHNGVIEAVYLDEGELISAGMDGFVRVWDFETIDNADITEESATFEMDPLSEIKVGNEVSVKSLARSVDPDTPTLWYAQDAGGAIWKIDIAVSHTRKAPVKLVSFHSGEVMGLACSPVAHQAASIAQDGSVRVYDLPARQLLCHSRFASGGSSLLWAPLEVDPSGSTLLAGFQDGVLRVLQLEECERRHQKGDPGYQLVLLHVCKPHSTAVSSLAVNSAGEVLACGGRDSTVFFLNIRAGYEPIGFVRTPAPVTTVQWSSKKEACLLVCCEDGSMLEVGAPVKEEVDTSQSYCFNPTRYAHRTFSSIKDRLRREEEETRRAAELERKRKEREATKQRRREQLGEDYVSEEEEEEQEEVEEEEGGGEVEEVKLPKGPSPILSAFYCSQDSREFWVSMGGYDAGYLYRCSMEGAGTQGEGYEAPHTLPVPAFSGEDLPIHALTFSSSGDYLLTGASNGCVRVHPLPHPHSLTSLHSYWALSMHDNHYGAVTHLATTFDDRYVVSAGADGNVFVYSANLPMATNRVLSTETAKAPTESRSQETAKDIEDPDHYSIEDAKQKAEHDRKMRLAEEKKQRVLRAVGALRRTFRRLQQRGRELPEHLRLEDREFVMDPNVEHQLRKRAEAKVELVRREAAWEGERHSVALSKLQKRYKNVVECERVTVWTFEGRESVSSFRSVVPSQEYLQLMEKVLSSEQTYTPWTVGEQRTRRVRPMGGEEGGGGASGVESSPHGQAAAEQLSKSEARRLRKEQRKREWEELYHCRPDEKYEAPEDVEALRQARKLMGYYHLKTSEDFVVPEEQRMTTQRKRRQLLLLRKQIFECKSELNKRLLHLRDWKLDIIERISSLVSQIEALQAQLPLSLHKPVPARPYPRPEEVPERQLEYTRESLLQFKSERKARETAERQAATGVGEGFGGFGGFGGGGGGEEEGKEEKEGEKEREEKKATRVEKAVEEWVREEEGKSKPTKISEQKEKREPSVWETLKQEKEVMAVYERDTLLKEVEQLKRSFDDTLLRLRNEKSYLEATVVAADLKHITQFEELQLLKEFEKRETMFTSRYRSKKQERSDMAAKMEEVQWAVSEKERQVGLLQEQEKALNASFSEAMGENKFKDFLLRVFRKKIKRQKRKPEGERVEGERDDGEGDDSGEESDSDYISSSEEEDESEVGDQDDSVCPPGCDPALFQKACEMRERRLDVEELLVEERRALEALRKELESMKKKTKSMEAQVKSALSDLQAFQLKKQQRLNELDQVVVLRLHQVLHNGPGGSPPSPLTPCIVFPACALLRLNQRIGELSVEKQQEKRKYRELKQKHVRLVREKKEMQHKVTELEGRVKEMMLLKFGQVVDLDRLEGLGTNRIAEELRGRLRALEHLARQDMADLEAQVETERHRLVAVTRENTHRLDQLHELLTAQTQVEQRLNGRQKSIGREVAGGGVQPDSHERRQLLQLVRLQARDIEALRGEIQLLSHKGGHILPPSQPPINPQLSPQ